MRGITNVRQWSSGRGSLRAGVREPAVPTTGAGRSVRCMPVERVYQCFIHSVSQRSAECGGRGQRAGWGAGVDGKWERVE